MLQKLEPYVEPILAACTLFPIIAAVFTLPFVIYQYRKYGGIAVLRVVVVYSFILYGICAFLLTVLPLPSPEAVAAMTSQPIGWIPGHDLYVGLVNAGLYLTRPATLANPEAWRAFLTGSDLFQILANIAMTVPLGFYLRYYFRLNWKQTLLAGFCVSLFFEVTQYSGLYGIYPKPYRYSSVDDLINNSLGAVLGYILTPLLSVFLPSRDEIDRISYRKGEKLTPLRSLCSVLLDVLLFDALSGIFWLVLREREDAPVFLWLPGVALLYFGLFPWLQRGATPGQAILHLRTVREQGDKPASFFQLLWRNILLYGVELFVLLLCGGFLGTFALTLMADTISGLYKVLLLIASIFFPAAALLFVQDSQSRWNAFPHDHYSRTKVIPSAIKPPAALLREEK